MKTEHTDLIVVKCKTPPRVELDTEASAVYVRFTRARIARTLRHGMKWPIVTIDVDARGHVVGVEFVGVRKFNLGYLLKQMPLKAPSRVINGASCVSAEVHRVAA